MMTLGLMSAAFAQTDAPATGLGQSWPNATDVSRNPHWHVYVFHLHGIDYVQINDLNGTVRAAVGTTNGVAIVLPVGVDALQVRTDTAALSHAATSLAAQTVYRDNATTVTATPQSDGTNIFTVTAICQDPYNCGGGRGG
ncbi:hypothetical protein WK53_28715 [Burkholderia ubonensis]|uniref:Uncharacterized protein n=2 Tax=Burkholderia ubonensis TaxID=101571 RepID=A0AAW3NJL3_9BURK|nr:hypothetical protein WK53_28715 [Burkholderia ubonensis]